MADYNNYSDYEELDLNGSIEQESQFTDIPVGDYEGIIDHYEIGTCDWDNENYNGKKMLTIYINVDAGGQEVQLRDNIVLVKNMEWKLSQFFTSIGQKKKGEPLVMNWNTVPGSTGTLELEINHYTKNDGSKGENNRVKKFLPKEQKSFVPGTF